MSPVGNLLCSATAKVSCPCA